jgi:tRNA wybutosine-synthesizing protein 1
MFIGGSRQRLTIENMPRHEETKQFAEQIAKETGYEIIGEQPSSRVVLLSSGEKDQMIKV